MKLTYSVRPVIRLDKKKNDGTCPIHFSVRVGAIATRIPSGKNIDEKDWDSKNNCPKKTSKANILIATFLNKKVSEFEINMLERENLNKPVTLTIAMEFFKGGPKMSFFKFWEEQLDLWCLSKEPNTLKSYRSCMNIVREFNPNLSFGDLTYTTIQKFDLHLRLERGNADGGAFTKHKCLKAIIRQAIMKGYIKDNPYEYFPIRSAKGNRKFLSIDEVRSLMTLEIPAYETFMHKVRDLFLFSCFTGLRYSDVMNLKWENIRTEPDRIELRMIKTNKSLIVPLVKNAKDILEKYAKLKIKVDSQNALPKLANQVVNRGLKDLMKLAEINKEISFHCARHSFASNHVQNKTNIVHLKDLLGHSKLEETQIYAKSLQRDLFESMNSLDKRYSHAG